MGLGKPMSKWALQETTGTTVADTIGANTGTATSGNARRFNGTSDYVQFTNPIIPVGAKTIKFKFRRNGVPVTTAYILDNSSVVNGSNGTAIFFVENFLRIWCGSASIFDLTYDVTNIFDNKWHEIMISWDGTINANGVKLYIDNMITPVMQVTATSTETLAATYNLRIGRNANSTNFFSGDLDDLQITNGYMGAGTEVAHWKMDDTVATAMVDSSPNAYAATVTGTTVLTNDSMPIIVSDGEGGYARHFNGRSDRITYTSQVLPLGAKSIRFKIRSGLQKSNCVIIDNANFTTTNKGTTIWVNDSGKVNMRTYNLGVEVLSLLGTVNICDNTWHTILLTWDGTIAIDSVKMFIDDMTTPATKATALSAIEGVATTNLFIGAVSSLSTMQFFEGDLKDITISVGTGNERTDPKDLQVGDFIRCHYSAPTSGAVGVFSGLGQVTANFIPPASSATPNGDFYLIAVDIDYLGRLNLIADRNVQHSINWDVLNSVGIASGSGLPYMFINTIIPIMTSKTAPNGQVSSSGIYSGYYDYTAFNRVVGSASNSWISSSVISWISYKFTEAKSIKRYSLMSSNNLATAFPKNWTFEGSNDALEWTVLDTQVNQTGWGIYEKRVFSIDNSSSYLYYRINITANNGYASYSEIHKIEMDDTEDSTFNFITRLLTGGISSTDKDNEWDNYIVGSSLNGTITSGDNNVWNWNIAPNGARSWTSTVASAAANRIVRAMQNNISGHNAYSTNAAPTTYIGFRPVLLVESLFTLLNKSFLYFDGSYQKWVDTSQVVMTQDTSFVDTGSLLRSPLDKTASKVEVI
jgi:hypothetical protein